MFKPRQNSLRTKKMRRALGEGFIIGHFGKMRPTNFPHTFLKILPALKQKYPDINVVFSDLTGIKSKLIKKYKVPYHFMPYALSACDLLLFPYWSAAGHYSGALRIKEAMACGVPIISCNFKARQEELGKNYEFFTGVHGKRHSTPQATEEMFNIISEAIENDRLRRDVGKKLFKRSKFYYLTPSAKRLENDFSKVIRKSFLYCCPCFPLVRIQGLQILFLSPKSDILCILIYLKS